MIRPKHARMLEKDLRFRLEDLMEFDSSEIDWEDIGSNDPAYASAFSCFFKTLDVISNDSDSYPYVFPHGTRPRGIDWLRNHAEGLDEFLASNYFGRWLSKGGIKWLELDENWEQIPPKIWDPDTYAFTPEWVKFCYTMLNQCFHDWQRIYQMLYPEGSSDTLKDPFDTRHYSRTLTTAEQMVGGSKETQDDTLQRKIKETNSRLYQNYKVQREGSSDTNFGDGSVNNGVPNYDSSVETKTENTKTTRDPGQDGLTRVTESLVAGFNSEPGQGAGNNFLPGDGSGNGYNRSSKVFQTESGIEETIVGPVDSRTPTSLIEKDDKKFSTTDEDGSELHTGGWTDTKTYGDDTSSLIKQAKQTSYSGNMGSHVIDPKSNSFSFAPVTNSAGQAELGREIETISENTSGKTAVELATDELDLMQTHNFYEMMCDVLVHKLTLPILN